MRPRLFRNLVILFVLTFGLTSCLVGRFAWYNFSNITDYKIFPSRPDFAKFGRLYLNDGLWNGTPVLPREWVRESTRSSREEGAVPYYKYQWWLTDKGFAAIGHLGQYVYVNRAKNIIIVRLGKKEGKVSWERLFDELVNRL